MSDDGFAEGVQQYPASGVMALTASASLGLLMAGTASGYLHPQSAIPGGMQLAGGMLLVCIVFWKAIEVVAHA